MPRIKVLDHGYVDLVESWGDDAGIVEAARMSTNKGFNGWGTPECPGDEKLLAYLYNNLHMTPFEMAGMTIEVQAPIFVFRQWHRHRTFGYNEMSARYTPLPDVNYVPTVERCMGDGGSNRQAGRISPLGSDSGIQDWIKQLEKHYDQSERLYQLGLSLGIQKELARIPIPVGRYSRMRATANLRNWLAFLSLRLDSHAQSEIRDYAVVVGSIVETLFPRTWELFIKKAKDG